MQHTLLGWLLHARSMHSSWDHRRKVLGLERELIIGNETTASKNKGLREIAGQVLPCQCVESILSIANFAGNVAVLPLHEVRHIIHATVDGDPEVIRPLVLINFIQSPGLIEVRAEQATKLDNVEDDSPIEQEN